MGFFKLKRIKNVLGLDISNSSIKAVQLNGSKGNYSLKGISNVHISLDGDERKKEIAKINSIRRCVDLSGIKSDQVVCAINGDEAIVRSFSFNSIKANDLDAAILNELEQISPLEMNKSVVDYEVVSSKQNVICGVIVSASPEAVETKKKLIEEASLHVVLMDTDSLATLNCFTEVGPSDKTGVVGLLSVRDTFTNLILAGEDDLPFIRTLNYLNQNIIEAISRKNKVSEGTIRSILSDGDLSAGENESVWETFKELTKDIVSEISGSIRYYANHNGKTDINKLYLCGDYPLINAIKFVYDDEISVEFELWNPLRNICDEKSLSKFGLAMDEGYGMSVALGLAMRDF